MMWETGSKVTRGRSDGFTLIELILVLAILTVMSALVAPMMFGLLRDNELMVARHDLELMARTARRDALVRQSRVELRMDGRGVSLWWGPEMTAEEPDRLAPDSQGWLEVDRINWPEGVVVRVLRWQERKWRTLDEEQVWAFQPSGLSEPLSIRFEQDRYWVEVDFSPLHGAVVDESYYLP